MMETVVCQVLPSLEDNKEIIEDKMHSQIDNGDDNIQEKPDVNR